MSYTAFVIGNIASGKSTACTYLASRGARHIDLDALAKSLYVPGSQLVELLANEFGWDILDEYGAVRAPVLAERAFETPESTQKLNSLVHPVLLDRLGTLVMPVQCCSTIVPSFPLTVVEVSAAASFTDAFGLADEIVAITAPLEIRRERAISRGMKAEDFNARSSVQPDEAQVTGLADYVIDNTEGNSSLFENIDAWLDARAIRGLSEVNVDGAQS